MVIHCDAPHSCHSLHTSQHGSWTARLFIIANAISFGLCSIFPRRVKCKRSDITDLVEIAYPFFLAIAEHDLSDVLEIHL